MQENRGRRGEEEERPPPDPACHATGQRPECRIATGLGLPIPECNAAARGRRIPGCIAIKLHRGTTSPRGPCASSSKDTCVCKRLATANRCWRGWGLRGPRPGPCWIWGSVTALAWQDHASDCAARHGGQDEAAPGLSPRCLPALDSCGQGPQPPGEEAQEGVCGAHQQGGVEGVPRGHGGDINWQRYWETRNGEPGHPSSQLGLRGRFEYALLLRRENRR